jgi:peptidoglycan/xylan/chitin deacetylase (PgdA/CDA1 family)
MVSLTFDDGPSAYTSAVLGILHRYHAHATFYVIGDHIGGHDELLRRMLREGDEIGNHTWNHHPGASRGQLVATSTRIHRATGFWPCLFRAPYGATSRGLIRTAASAHMTTIQWDVDPRDWSRPGSGAIYSRVVHGAHAGSIVVMHDGGGPRGETLAALPRIIRTLRHRGYRLVTTSRLLGNRPIFG